MQVKLLTSATLVPPATKGQVHWERLMGLCQFGLIVQHNRQGMGNKPLI